MAKINLLISASSHKLDDSEAPVREFTVSLWEMWAYNTV